MLVAFFGAGFVALWMNLRWPGLQGTPFLVLGYIFGVTISRRERWLITGQWRMP